jgi:peptidoglycan hydrolase-like protein with peptidoglycan-binding domain
MSRQSYLLLTAAAVALAAPAQAANLALVIDAEAEEAAETREALAETLAARGYEVVERTGADREAVREAVTEVADRLDEAERLILLFTGPIDAEDGRVWLLPAGFEGEGRIAAAFDGVALDLLLALAAERPGRAAVIVGFDEAALPEDAEPTEAEEPVEAAADVAEAAQDWARLDIPQGILVMAGPRGSALAAVAERLLSEGVSAAEAVADLHDVRVYGFASPDMSFADLPAERAEEAAEAPLAMPEPDMAAEPEAAPEALAEAAEAALALDQTARRAIQEDLTVLGYSTRGIDGIFGPGTRAAIAEWQEAEGLEATGYLTAEQVALLRERATARTAELREEAERARAAEEEADAAFWRMTGQGGTAADLRAYLARYPDGIYAAEARAQLDALEAEAREAAEAEDRAAWDEAVAAGGAEAFRRYLEERPDGAFAAEAEARIEAIEEAPAREAAEAEARAREEALGLNTASRALIESQLQAVGHDVGAADGSFDSETRRAIREFQTRQGLEVTGYVDQATIQALIVASLGLR